MYGLVVLKKRRVPYKRQKKKNDKKWKYSAVQYHNNVVIIFTETCVDSIVYDFYRREIFLLYTTPNPYEINR